MTRKDYVSIASHLAVSRLHRLGACSNEAQLAFGHAVRAVGDALAADNPRFDRTRFLAAVYGVKEGK
jgi:hypothetical protein